MNVTEQIAAFLDANDAPTVRAADYAETADLLRRQDGAETVGLKHLFEAQRIALATERAL